MEIEAHKTKEPRGCQRKYFFKEGMKNLYSSSKGSGCKVVQHEPHKQKVLGSIAAGFELFFSVHLFCNVSLSRSLMEVQLNMP